MLRIRVSTASAEITETELITAGRVGLQCAFEFNDAWDGLAKTVVIHGGVKRYIVLVGNTILVPGECLARENFPLRIGVYGQDGSGNIVIPTIWVNFGKIRPSAGPIVIPEITPNVAAQIQYNSSEALRIAQEIQEKADNGEFNGRDGATGPRGEDGTDGQNGNSIWTTTETPMPASGGVVFTQLTGRSGIPPVVGDVIVRSSRYVYDVVEVTPGGVVIGHLIGDIKGATGARGPKGDTGLTGPQGPGVTEDLRAALLQLAQKVAYIDEHGADYYQDLYNALYLPSDIVFITAVFNQGTTKVMDTDSLDSLKPMLTVFGHYDDNTSVVLTNYTLTGVLTPGTSTVTVSALGKTTTFDVVVTGMTSISAVYTQSGTVYDTDTLDSLKADLVVTAHFSDSSTQTVPAADYTLSGALEVGTSTITVNYGGKSTTFTVNVTHAVQKFSVTNSLTEVTNSNNATTADEESAYSAVLTANSGYVISSVSITMGGTDITTSVYSNGTISIASVTGDIVITAAAVEDVGWLPDVPYEIEWTDGYCLDPSTGDEKAYSTWSVSDFLPCDGLKNVNVAGTTGDGVFCYNANKEFLALINVSSANNTQLFQLRFDAKYIRTDKKTTNSQTVTPIILPVLGQGVAPDAGTIYSLSMIFGKTVWNSTGAETDSNNGKCSDFALCYGFSTITFSKKVRAFVAFYDANKAFLSSKTTGTTNSSVTVPEGATYFRYDITGYSNEWPDVKLE